MKSLVFSTTLLLLCAVFSQASCQSNKHRAPGGKSVYVSEKVLKTAEWAGFDYKKNLDEALHGNVTSMQKLFEFMKFVDGVERSEHAVTCYEIILVVGDQVYSSAVQNLYPKFRDVFRQQLIFATGRTENPDLKGKQLAQTFPYTWGALNHAPLGPDGNTKGQVEKITPADPESRLLPGQGAGLGTPPVAPAPAAAQPAEKPAEGAPADKKPGGGN